MGVWPTGLASGMPGKTFFQPLANKQPRLARTSNDAAIMTKILLPVQEAAEDI
jgi:hypothetical protein